MEKKINDSYEVARSMKICKELEQQFGLVPLKKGEREFELPKPKKLRENTTVFCIRYWTKKETRSDDRSNLLCLGKRQVLKPDTTSSYKLL